MWHAGSLFSDQGLNPGPLHWELSLNHGPPRKSPFSWPHRATCGMLVPCPGIEPIPLAMIAQSPNQWIARESQIPQNYLKESFHFFLHVFLIFQILYDEHILLS